MRFFIVVPSIIDDKKIMLTYDFDREIPWGFPFVKMPEERITIKYIKWFEL